MFVDNEMTHLAYRGYNPSFVKRVREKRAQQRRAEALGVQDRTLAKAGANEAINVLASERDEKLSRLASMDVITPKDFAVRFVAQRGFLWQEIISDSRKHPVVQVRHAAILAVIEAFPALSFPKVGHLFRRDHTSIIHVVRKAGQPGQSR